MYEATKIVVESTMLIMALQEGYHINKDFFDGIIKIFIKMIASLQARLSKRKIQPNNQTNTTTINKNTDQFNEQTENQAKMISLSKDIDN